MYKQGATIKKAPLKSGAFYLEFNIFYEPQAAASLKVSAASPEKL